MYNPQLETFLSVAENGSFSKAAEALFITPTAVMKQINALEDRLGITLFQRTNHGLQITEAGKSFLQDTKYIIDYSERAVEKAKDIDSKEKRQSIRIGTSIMTPAKFLLDLWTELQKHSSAMQIELIPFENTPENAREILKNLGKHIDVVAGIYDDDFLIDRKCQAAYLSDKMLSLAVPLTHPLCNRQVITLNDLMNTEIMFITKGWKVMDDIRKDLILKGIHFIDFDFFNINAFNKAVKENVPIMAIDGWENIHPLLKIIPVEWEYKIPFGIMYSLTPSRQVTRFIDTICRIQGGTL